MDLETISREDLHIIALFIYNKQLDIIAREIRNFMEILTHRFKQFEKNPQFIITGLSAEFLIRKSLIILGYQNIKNYEEVTTLHNKISSSAFAVAGALNFNFNKKE